MDVKSDWDSIFDVFRSEWQLDKYFFFSLWVKNQCNLTPVRRIKTEFCTLLCVHSTCMDMCLFVLERFPTCKFWKVELLLQGGHTVSILLQFLVAYVSWINNESKHFYNTRRGFQKAWRTEAPGPRPILSVHIPW